jgi:flagellar biosynthesis chaperone FliJ
MQKLREQQHATWRTATQRAEQAELEELAALARGAKVGMTRHEEVMR